MKHKHCFLLLLPALITASRLGAQTCTANFYYSYEHGTTVFFHNTSTGLPSGSNYTWDFGDNSPTVSTSTAAHAYSANGTYVATLTAANNTVQGCVSTKTLAVTVGSGCGLTAGFSASNGSNGQVTFASTSTGTTSATMYYWSFGSQGLQAQNVSYSGPFSVTYPNGTYVAVLTISNSSVNPTCGSTFTQAINVNNNTCNPVASFTSLAYAPLCLSLMSTSTGTNGNTGYIWSFGDGSNSGPQMYPGATHTYVVPGAYTVKLKIFDVNTPSCADSAVSSVTVTGCAANASFSLVQGNAPQLWHAIPAWPGNVTAASWSWGDGSSTNTLYTSHQYSAAGTYSICLSVTVSCGASNSFCTSQYIFRSANPSAQDMISVTVVPPGFVGITESRGPGKRLELFPNPAHRKVFVKCTSPDAELDAELFDCQGKLILKSAIHRNPDEGVFQVSLAGVNPGFYVLKLSNGRECFMGRLAVE